MKNLVYAGVIAVCVLVAVVVFVKTRGGNSGIEDIADDQKTWVKCLKCSQSYEMGLKPYLREVSEKAMANPSMLVTPLLTCQKCSKDGLVKACKCEKCSEVFREGTVQNDYPDRCPKCKHSATEAKRKANAAANQQG